MTLVTVAGTTTCPTGFVTLHTGSIVAFLHPSNNNMTSDSRCWESMPTSTTEFTVARLGDCVVCRIAK